MNRAVKSILLLSLLAVGAAPASAFPAFLQIFQADPFRNPEVSGWSSRPGEFHPEDRVAGGSCPPPAPTERSVRISRTALFRIGFTAQRETGTPDSGEPTWDAVTESAAESG